MAQCRNETSVTLAVYGPKPAKNFTFDNNLYYLGAGNTSLDCWDCDGVYVPNDMKIVVSTPSGGTYQGPCAVKIAPVPTNFTFIIRSNPNPSVLEININPVAVWQPGQLPNGIKWEIPNESQSSINTRTANARDVVLMIPNSYVEDTILNRDPNSTEISYWTSRVQMEGLNYCDLLRFHGEWRAAGGT